MTQIPITENLNLDQFSDADLQAELKRREEVKKEEQLQHREEQATFWQSKIDLLLEVVPKHCRTSCSDTKAINDERCTRCYLLSCQSSGFWDSDRSLHIHTSKLPEIK